MTNHSFPLSGVFTDRKREGAVIVQAVRTVTLDRRAVLNPEATEKKRLVLSRGVAVLTSIDRR